MKLLRTTPENFRWALAMLLGVASGYVAVLLANPRFFYSDDTELQYVPLWVNVGRMLREGHFPTVIPEEWMAGNYLVEGQSSLFNPPQALINFMAPSFANLIVLATVVKLIYTLILALGIYRVCLVYGARAPWAAVAGVAFPFSGWALFFDQATWALALAGAAWMTHAWASGVRYARGLSGPIPVFVFLVFTIGVGYIWPGVEAGLLMACVIVGEVIWQRQVRGPLKLSLAAASAGLACVIVYIAGVLTSDVTWRSTSGIQYAGEMTMSLRQSLNIGLPTTYPGFNSWFGNVLPMPATYVAWFLVPGLCFIGWRKAAQSLRELSGVLLFTTIIGLWIAGPAVLGPLRWPVRAFPMFALGLIVLVCILLSRHGTLRWWWARSAVAASLIGLMAYGANATVPTLSRWHFAGAAAVALAGVAVLVLAKFGRAAVCAALIISVAPVAYLQVERSDPHPLAFGTPGDIAEMRAGFPDFEGTTLQLARLPIVKGPKLGPLPSRNGLDERFFGSLTLGNFPQTLGLDYINGYTPVGFEAFTDQFCLRWDGTTCVRAFEQAFRTERTTGLSLVDLMKVDRLVIDLEQFPQAGTFAPPAGWHWTSYPGHNDVIAVLERDRGLISTEQGRISAVIDATALTLGETDSSSRVRVSSTQGGQIVFARLAWPGYHATLDGKEIATTEVLSSFLAVDIPAGTRDGELVVEYEFPGWKIGAATAAGGFALIALLQVLHLRSRRKPQLAEPVGPDTELQMQESFA